MSGSGDLKARRAKLIAVARMIEQGKPLPAGIRTEVASALRIAAMGATWPLGQQESKKRGAKAEAERLRVTGTSRPLRLAAIVRLFQLAGVPVTKATQALSIASSVSAASIYAARKEWGIATEDVQRLFEDAQGAELSAVKADRNPHSRKLARFLLERLG